MKGKSRQNFIIFMIFLYINNINAEFVDINTKECGLTKGCYRMPENCKGRDCISLVTFRKLENKSSIYFEMQSQAPENIRWTSVGFSIQSKMGNNFVVDCIFNQSSGQHVIQRSWNEGFENVVLSNRFAGIDQSLPMSLNFSNGFIQCSFSMKVKVIGEKFTPDFENAYYILLARGPITLTGVKLKHTEKTYMTPKKVNLSSVINMSGNKKDPLVLAHGSLMLIGWMLLGSTGMLIPRYYKTAFGLFRSTHIWFLVHRFLMITAAIMGLVSFILIFIKRKGYSRELSGVSASHPIIGVVVTFLSILNPIIAIFRPPPLHEKRFIFNHVHRLIGIFCHIGAVFNIFAITFYDKTYLNTKSSRWVILAYALFHLLMEILLIAIKIKAKRRSNSQLQLNNREDDELKPSYDDQNRIPVTFILCIYCLVITGLVLALLIPMVRPE